MPPSRHNLIKKPEVISFVPFYESGDYASTIWSEPAILFGGITTHDTSIVLAVALFVCLIAQATSIFRTRVKCYTIALLILLGIHGEFANLFPSDVPENSQSRRAFAVNAICLVLGPSFVNTAFTVALKHCVVHLLQQRSLSKVRWYPVAFISIDFVAIIVKTICAGYTTTASVDSSQASSGPDIARAFVVASVLFHAINMIASGVIILVLNNLR